MGEGLITLDGERWKEHRRVLQPAFTAHSLTQQLEHLVYGVRKQLDKWAGLAGSGAPADLVDEMNELVSRAFGMALINRDLDKDLIRAVAIASESVYRRSVGMEVVPWFIPTPYNRRKRWAHRKLDSVAAEIVAARAAGDDREDIAGLLLRSGLPSKAFRDNLRTVFLAGADTTAMGLAWAVWELAAHPEIRDQVEREVDEVIGDRVPTEQDLDALPVTRAVIDETLRLHPPIWVMPRSANDADVIDGRPIRKHTSVLMPFFAIQRSPRHWPDPDSFDHRRFQGSTDVRRAGAYLPFGAGKHQCIGKELALTTLVLALAMLSRRFRVAIDGAQPVRQKAFTTLQPDPGMRVTISERVRSEAEPAGERVHP
jgi:cytochrome P450